MKQPQNKQISPGVCEPLPLIVDKTIWSKRGKKIPLLFPGLPEQLYLAGYEIVSKDGRQIETVAVIYKRLDAIKPNVPVLIRLDSACTRCGIGDKREACRWQLEESYRVLSAHDGPGMVIHFTSHDGKGHGLVKSLRQYTHGTFPANCDRRDFTPGITVLRDLGVKQVILMTANVSKLRLLEKHGIVVVSTMPLTSKKHREHAGHYKLSGHLPPEESGSKS
jgi:GTP cyclohydrolase II